MARKTYQINAKYFRYNRATIHLGQYNNGTLALEVHQGPDRDVISINLAAYGLVPGVNEFFVKAYAEHTGLAEALEEAGIAMKIAEATYGPFDTQAYLMRLTIEEDQDA